MIDKDRASALLAEELRADALIIATDVAPIGTLEDASAMLGREAGTIVDVTAEQIEYGPDGRQLCRS